MDGDGLFPRTFSILERSLDLRAMRHELLSSNIANMDTPSYRAYDLDIDRQFDAELGRQTELELQRTSRGHISGPNEAGGKAGGNAEENVVLFSLRGDGNSVDLERSMADLSENSLMFNTSAQIITSKYKGMVSLIDGVK